MTLQEYLNEKNISKYRLSKISGIPNTTIADICSNKSSLHRCSAITIQKLAKALNLSMEDVMAFDSSLDEYEEETGLPKRKEYLEKDLPTYLQTSLKNMKASLEILDRGEMDYHWDLNWGELNADINCAEVDQEITSEQAWYLREKYLRIKREEY